MLKKMMMMMTSSPRFFGSGKKYELMPLSVCLSRERKRRPGGENGIDDEHDLIFLPPSWRGCATSAAVAFAECSPELTYGIKGSGLVL